MATLTAQPMPVGGLQPTYTAADPAGDAAPVGTGLLLHVHNGGAGPVTVTLATPGTAGGLGIEETEQAVPAEGDAFVPLRAVYRSPVTGRAVITYSDATSVDVAVLQMP